VVDGSHVGGDDEQTLAVAVEHHRHRVPLPGPGSDGGEQDEPVPVHTLDVTSCPELLDHLTVDVLDVHVASFPEIMSRIAAESGSLPAGRYRLDRRPGEVWHADDTGHGRLEESPPA
jgi:hypothetical protein